MINKLYHLKQFGTTSYPNSCIYDEFERHPRENFYDLSDVFIILKQVENKYLIYNINRNYKLHVGFKFFEMFSLEI